MADKTTALKNSNGWTWLLYDIDRDRLVIENTTNAGCPFSAPLYMKCILVCDTWEHAYSRKKAVFPLASLKKDKVC